MQLNFLQEDLLEILQKDGGQPAVALQRPAKSGQPEQISFLPEVPPAPKKTAARPAPRKEPEVERKIAAAASAIASPMHEEKAPNAFKTISEAAEILGVPAYVLRFWESQFPQISPTKSRGGRRYYRPEDMDVLASIQHLLYKQGYTIKGARKAFSQMKNDVIAESPVAVQLPEAVKKPVITPKQKSQLSAIRSELLTLRDQLSSYL